uniref:Uncharacterized protein n=1 Tax=Clastoptera arizonana TaxID=38151 RepID=A0A1B6DCP6_9HEMI
MFKIHSNKIGNTMKSSIILFLAFLLLENNITPAITGKTFKKGITFLKERNKYFLDSTTQEENKIEKQLEDGKDNLIQNFKDENIWQLERTDEINEVFQTEATQVKNLTINGAELLGLVSGLEADLLMDKLALQMRNMPQITNHLKKILLNPRKATNLTGLCIDLMESWQNKVLHNLLTIKKSLTDRVAKVFDFILGNNPDISDLDVWGDVSRNNLIVSAKKDVSEMMTNGERRIQRMLTCITKRISELIDGISTKVKDIFLFIKNKLKELAGAAMLKVKNAILLSIRIMAEIMAGLVKKTSEIIKESSTAVNNFLAFIWEIMDEIKNWSDQEMNKINTTPKVMIPRNMF